MKLGKSMEQRNLRNEFIRVIGGLLIKVDGRMGHVMVLILGD